MSYKYMKIYEELKNGNLQGFKHCFLQNFLYLYMSIISSL